MEPDRRSESLSHVDEGNTTFATQPDQIVAIALMQMPAVL